MSGAAFLALIAGTYVVNLQLINKSSGSSVTLHDSLVDRATHSPEAIPQMTNTTSCEFNDTRNWVCRDGLTLTAADSGKLYLFLLGPVDKGVQVSHAHLRTYSR
jgi:hypothetical protein